MNHRLMPCSACQRHIFFDEQQCPFCGAAVVARKLAPLPQDRMNRRQMALFAAATAAASLGAGCTGAPGSRQDSSEVADASVAHRDSGDAADAPPATADSGGVADASWAAEDAPHTCYGAPPARA
jgi:hypothetical protein